MTRAASNVDAIDAELTAALKVLRTALRNAAIFGRDSYFV